MYESELQKEIDRLGWRLEAPDRPDSSLPAAEAGHGSNTCSANKIGTISLTLRFQVSILGYRSTVGTGGY